MKNSKVVQEFIKNTPQIKMEYDYDWDNKCYVFEQELDVETKNYYFFFTLKSTLNAEIIPATYDYPEEIYPTNTITEVTSLTAESNYTSGYLSLTDEEVKEIKKTILEIVE